GIRDVHVTGVQTCALPISRVGGMAAAGMLILLVLVFWAAQSQTWAVTRIWAPLIRAAGDGTGKAVAFKAVLLSVLAYTGGLLLRSGERRVGRGGRARRAGW